MKPKVFKTDEEHAEALAHVRALMDAAPGAPEAEELELYALLVEEYEKRRWPIELPDPIDAIEFRRGLLGSWFTLQDLRQTGRERHESAADGSATARMATSSIPSAR
jgi:HTH-type transcriptional regulator/antitoxin HigA